MFFFQDLDVAHQVMTVVPKKHERLIKAIVCVYICVSCFFAVELICVRNMSVDWNSVIRNPYTIFSPEIITSRFPLPTTTEERSTEATKVKEDGEESPIPNWQRNLRQRSRNSSYYLTAVIRVRIYKEDKARWTVAELKQWLHYQFWAGAEHVYVCNHFLNQSENLAKPLEKYVKLGLVTVFPWNHIRAVPGSDTYHIDNGLNQDACYNHVAERYGNLSVWQYSFDIDENPFCKTNKREGFLSDFLKKIEAGESGNTLANTTVDIRAQNFVLHGQGDRSRNIHYDRINRITPRIANHNWKAIYKPKYVRDVAMHGPKIRTVGKVLVANPEKLKLLHYWGGRLQNWGPDMPALFKSTVEFNDVRNTIAKRVRESLLAFNETDAFSCDTGP